MFTYQNEDNLLKDFTAQTITEIYSQIERREKGLNTDGLSCMVLDGTIPTRKGLPVKCYVEYDITRKEDNGERYLSLKLLSAITWQGAKSQPGAVTAALTMAEMQLVS